MPKNQPQLGKWIAIVAAGLLVVGYAAAMLLIPSMPLADPYGEFLQTSRLELWLVDVASLSDLWQQWTGGLLYASWIDRVPILLLASGWLAASWWIGHPIATRESLDPWNGLMATRGCSIAIGHAILSLMTLANGWIFGPRVFLPLALSTVIAALAPRWYSMFYRATPSTAEVETAMANSRALSAIRRKTDKLTNKLNGKLLVAEKPRSVESDPSFASSWSRRLIGLSVVGAVWLATIAVLGSCLPSYDADVREIEMLSTKKYYLDNSICWFDLHRAANGPQGNTMPALAITSLLEAIRPSASPEAMLRHLTCAWLAGQVLHASLWLIAILMIASSIRWRFGALAAALTAFLLIAHPGMHELVRLGGRAGGVMLWITASMVLIQYHHEKPIPKLSSWSIAAGAFSYQSLLGIFLGSILLYRMIHCVPRDRQRYWNDRNAMASRSVIARLAILTVFVAAAIPWQLRVYLHGPALSHDFVPTLAIAYSNIARLGASLNELVDAFNSILWNSMAHGLLLIPLAAIGAVTGYRDREIRFSSIAWLVWLFLWWLFTTHLDRDWVVATPMLAWPAAQAIQWLRERSGGYLIFPLALISLAWSTIALAAWPTADPRLLVAIDQLIPTTVANAKANIQATPLSRHSGPDQPRAGEGRGDDPAGSAARNEAALEPPIDRAGQGGAVNPIAPSPPPSIRLSTSLSTSPSANLSTYPIYTDWINSHKGSYGLPSPAPSSSRWLVIGTTDTFFLTVPTLEVGLSELASLELLLRSHSKLLDRSQSDIHHLVIDWRSIAAGDRIARSSFEASIRDAVLKLEQSGAISRIPWDYLSSDAECFSVGPAEE